VSTLSYANSDGNCEENVKLSGEEDRERLEPDKRDEVAAFNSTLSSIARFMRPSIALLMLSWVKSAGASKERRARYRPTDRRSGVERRRSRGQN
jgi:hypothetical protein